VNASSKPDTLIAATACLSGLPVVTANARDFERVAGYFHLTFFEFSLMLHRYLNHQR
jgi:predicted aconitase with swiveling domain